MKILYLSNLIFARCSPITDDFLEIQGSSIIRHYSCRVVYSLTVRWLLCYAAETQDTQCSEYYCATQAAKRLRTQPTEKLLVLTF